MLLGLRVLVEMYLEVPDLLIVGGNACGAALTKVDHFLRTPLLVTPFEHVSFKVEVSLLISVEVALLLKETLNADLARVYGHWLLLKLRHPCSLRVRLAELGGEVILLLVLGVRGELTPAGPLVNIDTHLL